jgi:hypothetical protein
MLRFKKLIVLFWCAWWSVALWTDIVGGLAHLGYLQTSWAPDINYPFLVKSLSMYPLPDWLTAIFFIGIIFWLLLNVVLFAYVCCAFNQSKAVWLPRAERAFMASVLLWLAFFISDQLIMDFSLEANHMIQGGFQLLTWLSLYLLPDETST